MTVGQPSVLSELAPARVDIGAGSAFDLLLALSTASAASRSTLGDDLRTALDAVGDTAGETWLNLVGVALDAGPPYTARRLRSAVRRLDPVELRRHLLGRYAWSWCTLAGTETIERAAAGDAAATRNLLGQQRYYAGHAREALSTLLALDPAATQRRITEAFAAGERVLVADPSALEDAQAAAADAVATLPLAEAVARVTAGYRYVAEPEAGRVLLVPHAQPHPALALVQHRGTRVILYRARVAGGLEERVAALGRALADPKRVEILALLGRAVNRVPELVDETGLSRSTVHHHLGLLRDAGLVELEGNARAYLYVPRSGALEDTTSLLAEVLPDEST